MIAGLEKEHDRCFDRAAHYALGDLKGEEEQAEYVAIRGRVLFGLRHELDDRVLDTKINDPED